MKLTCPFWLIIIGLNTTESVGPSLTVAPPAAYENTSFGPNPLPVTPKLSAPIVREACRWTACVGVKFNVKLMLLLGCMVNGIVGAAVIEKSAPLRTSALMVPLIFPLFFT